VMTGGWCLVQILMHCRSKSFHNHPSPSRSWSR
jgi:hypothetical protein